MNFIEEKNQRRTKKAALLMTIAFHIALFGVLYSSASKKPEPSAETSVKIETKAKDKFAKNSKPIEMP